MLKVRTLSFQFTCRQLCSESNIIIEKVGQVTTIGINRPEKRNAINLETVKQLSNAFQVFNEDKESLAAVLYGTGGNFCSGYDLKEIANVTEDVHEYIKALSLESVIKHVKKPLVASLSGYTVASGLELALHCDLRVIEDNAVIGFFGRRYGIPTMDGGTVRLQAIVGLSRALDMILTGRAVAAKEAFEWGIANRIVACGTGLGQSIQLATSLVKFHQECLQIDKCSTYNAAFNNYEDSLLKEKENAMKISSKDIIEGAKQFVTGVGKHGKTYNLTNKALKDWEKELVNINNKF